MPKTVAVKIYRTHRAHLRQTLPSPLKSLAGFPEIVGAMLVVWDKLTERQKLDAFKVSQESVPVEAANCAA